MKDANWSAPEADVLDSARELLDGPERGVLATIIAVDGSAYRRPGAKMVVREDGEGIGHITAGCLEDEVGRLAEEVLEAGEPRVERYDLRPDTDDDVWGLGVGCNGLVTILLEPLDESYRAVVDAVDEGRNVGVVTVVDAEEDESAVGARGYYHPEDESFDLDRAFPGDVAERVRPAVADLASRGRADSFEIEGYTVFVDGIATPDDLVVVGTGNDVGPVVELGARAGFRVTVAGFRGSNATPERFPEADEVVSTSPARIREKLDLHGDTYVVVATHNFVDDRIAVDELLASPVPYVGLLGPRERFEEMLEEFETEERTFTEDELDRLYTPVGLDLGGGAPYQIALSIVAEVLAVSNDRRPEHLKEREGPIHERIELASDD